MKITTSQFKGTSAKNPIDITLEDALDMMQFDEPLMHQVIEIREEPNEDEQQRLKCLLPSITFGAHFDIYRTTKVTDKMKAAGFSETDISYQGTGVAIIEYDHVTDAAYLKDELFDNYPYIISAFISPRGKGIKTLVRIPVVSTPQEYDRHWDALMEEFKAYRPDPGNYGVGRLLFLSHDTGLRERSYEQTIEYTIPEGFASNGSPRVATQQTESPEIRTKNQKRIREWLIKAFDNIPDDNRHPHMMKKLKRAGGLVPKYCTYEWIVNLCDVIIETDSKYDQISTRKQNIRDGIKAGMGEPLDMDDLTAIDFDEVRERTRLDMTAELIEPPACLMIDGAIGGSLGNVITFMGPAKSRKTFFLTAVIAACVKGGSLLDGKIEGIKVDDRDVLRYYDTEQSQFHLQKAAHRVMRMAGLELTDPRIEFYGLAAIPTHERLAFIDYMITTNDDAWGVAIDGIRDLMKDINSSEDSTDILDYIQRWKFDKNMLVIGLLHQNKTDRNLRGHIGTEIMNKSESVIRVEKDKKDKTISIVSAEEMRNKEFEPFAFKIDDLEDVCLTDMPLNNDKPSKGPEIHEDETHINCIDAVFENVHTHNTTQIKQQIMSWFAKHTEADFKDGVAKKYVDYYMTSGWIKTKRMKSMRGTWYVKNIENDLFS